MRLLEQKFDELSKRSEEGVIAASSKFNEALEKLQRRIAMNENNVLELSSSHQQVKAFKRSKVESIEKELFKLNDLVTGKIWTKVHLIDVE